MTALQKLMKSVFLFHLKNSFRSRDIKVFVFLSSSLSLPVSHCFSGSSKVKLKVFDVINSITRNVIWLISWEGIKGTTLKYCPLIEYYVSNIFMEKSYQKFELKACPRPLFNFSKSRRTEITRKRFF